ncbi:hypothetical protein GDO81_003230 [Engystomops pustulosus]|uniref:Uncharacterized protein n=1 Tax=Engystomops pustulosus TaxID=76066 RepID=A0AAV6ZX11_ENGPU|nr:hypothetical protein GDO81_003230 [Engystomops pustulosus]
MASYLPILLLICLQISGNFALHCSRYANDICPWQIGVIVLLSITLFILLILFLVLIFCKCKGGCNKGQASGDVYLQNLGCRTQQ